MRKRWKKRLSRSRLTRSSPTVHMKPLVECPRDELYDSFQDFLDGYAPPPRRSRRRVSVREARRILAQQEEDRLVDWDTVIESAVRRVEQAGRRLHRRD